MRLFVAVELPEEVKRQLMGLQKNIAGVRWLPTKQLHLTVLFLGEVDDEKLTQIINALAEIKLAPFTLQIAKTGCFPNARAPRVLWIDLEREPMLERLYLLVRTAAETCGILLEKRSFSPHITLARLKQSNSADISSFIHQTVSDNILPITVQQFALFQSVLTQQGATHRQIQAFPCGMSRSF